MWELRVSTKFKKDLKRYRQQPEKLAALKVVLNQLANKGWNIETLFNKLIKSIQHPKELGEYCSVPACYFSSRFISFLAMLNASICHDIYTEPWQMGDDYDKESGLTVIP